MLEGQFAPLRIRVLVIDDELKQDSAEGHAARAMVHALELRNLDVVQAYSAADGMTAVTSDAAIHAVLMDWMLGDDDANHKKAKALLDYIRERNDRIPVFLMAERKDSAKLPVEIMQRVNEFIWTLEDTASFVSGRVEAAARRYIEELAPPMAAALARFARVHEYSWHTPGHTGGTAFLKSTVGRVFYDYFGENLLRSDLSISVGELGSLLDHSGPIGESEKYCARVFGADRAYTVTNGGSTSNRVILMASVTRGEYALCDRNAHTSTEQALTMTGVIPTYLLPARNHLGIIGPIHPERLAPEMIQAAIGANPLAQDKSKGAIHAIITNSTYDGLTYDVPRVIDLLDHSVDRIHFDEAWLGHARFNPLYQDRFAMYGDPKDYPRDKPTIFMSTSTHKLLAALSQAALINVRDGRRPVEHRRFNEAFMMHATTSPQYAIIVSNEVSAAMMDGAGGRTMTTEAIAEAVAFRKAVRRYRRDYAEHGDWFFSTWNADAVTDPATGCKTAFEDAPDALLIENSDCW